MDTEFFKGKSVVVMGLGKFGGGVDSAVFAAKAGARVTVTDLAEKEVLADALEKLSPYDICYHLGKHLGDDFDDSSDTDIVIVNPAVPPESKFIKLARNAGKTITSQIEIFFKLCPAKIVGITGANGKSTTTALTAHLLGEATERKVWLGGNIGNRPLLEIVDQVEPDDIVVLELSSFQTEQLAESKQAPAISVITNLTPNHLDRHGTFQQYCDAKENIFKYQILDENSPAVSIFNGEDDITKKWFKDYKKQGGRKCEVFKVSDVGSKLKRKFKLAGKMNLSNLAAALAICDCFSIDKDRLAKAVSTFKSLPNRLELVAEINGVRWYDDSIATTPPSAIAAIEAFEEPKIIIAGGYDKLLPFDKFGQMIAEKTKGAVLIGQTAEKIAKAVSFAGGGEGKAEIALSMEQAVKMASRKAKPGDVVLMSPACASYDMFESYRQRGEIFAECVKKLGIRH